jgi:hypothetical protein
VHIINLSLPFSREPCLVFSSSVARAVPRAVEGRPRSARQAADQLAVLLAARIQRLLLAAMRRLRLRRLNWRRRGCAPGLFRPCPSLPPPDHCLPANGDGRSCSRQLFAIGPEEGGCLHGSLRSCGVIASSSFALRWSRASLHHEFAQNAPAQAALSHLLAQQQPASRLRRRVRYQCTHGCANMYAGSIGFRLRLQGFCGVGGRGGTMAGGVEGMGPARDCQSDMSKQERQGMRETFSRLVFQSGV